MTNKPWNFTAFDTRVLGAEIVENLDYYAPDGSDDTFHRDHDRLVELVAYTIQTVASDITDAAAKNPDLTPTQIVQRMRDKATKLHPDSARKYDPMCEWGPEEEWSIPRH